MGSSCDIARRVSRLRLGYGERYRQARQGPRDHDRGQRHHAALPAPSDSEFRPFLPMRDPIADIRAYLQTIGCWDVVYEPLASERVELREARADA